MSHTNGTKKRRIAMSKRNYSKIHEALELLNEAAREKKDEFYDLLEGEYSDLREALENVAETGQELLSRTARNATRQIHRTEKRIKEAATAVDEKVHEDPWLFLAGVAVSSFVLGFLKGHKNNR